MTRINLVNVKDLADQHAMSEWREIKMIIPSAMRSLKTQTISMICQKISSQYTLNTGHIIFFYNKLNFLKDRFDKLTDELYQRGYNIKPFDFSTKEYYYVCNHIIQHLWTPTKKDIQISIDRLSQRLNERPTWYRYYGDICRPDFFIDRYNQQLLVDTLIA